MNWSSPTHLDVVPSGAAEECRVNGGELTHRPVGQVVRCSELIICQGKIKITNISIHKQSQESIYYVTIY